MCQAAGICFVCQAAGIWFVCQAAGIWFVCQAAGSWFVCQAAGICFVFRPQGGHKGMNLFSVYASNHAWPYTCMNSAAFLECDYSEMRGPD